MSSRLSRLRVIAVDFGVLDSSFLQCRPIQAIAVADLHEERP
ncbi:hypothetical protein [Lysobacter antibioticus]|nr:hypothetical protein [Lysobacter antibioticus]